MLLEGASCVIALPGGLGTFDELMDAACLKQLAMIPSIPICVINVDGYYDPLLKQLRLGKDSSLIRLDPDSIVHSETTAAAALSYCKGRAIFGKTEPSEVCADCNTKLRQ
jgi:hypothetical protein